MDREHEACMHAWAWRGFWRAHLAGTASSKAAAAARGGGCAGAEIVDRSLRFVGGGVEMSMDFGAPADDPKAFRNICRDRTSAPRARL